MKKTISYLAFCILAIGNAVGAPLSPELAIQRVKDNGNIVALETGTRASVNSPRLKLTLKDIEDQPAIYVFEPMENRGFMVVSADDAVPALLGYSDNGVFDPDNLPPVLKYWLEEYGNQIEFLRSNSTPGTRGIEESSSEVTFPSSWTPIEPLISTKWNQNAPYNILCPLDGDTKSYTGCVATSMAQVMKYFNHPAEPTGYISYYCSSLRKTLSLNLNEIKFDWNNMLDSYSGSYTPTQANAVATLMQAAGYSVQMEYSAGESGTVSGILPYAFTTYFRYDKSVTYYKRAQYEFSKWAQMIYDNLKNVGPVIYDGQGSAGGHSFICDGYQGNGYFHFNWGWGGVSNGYFLLDVLNPQALGIGAGAGGYNFRQSALLNLKPATDAGSSKVQDQVYMYGTMVGSVNSSTLTLDLVDNTTYLGWGYLGVGKTIIFDLGATSENINDPSDTFSLVSENQYNKRIELDNFSIWPLESTINGKLESLRPTFSLSSLDLKDGKYKVTASYQPLNGEWAPITCDYGNFNYCILTKSGNSYSVQNFNPVQFSS